MNGKALRPRSLTKDAFAPFGTVMSLDGCERREINAGLCTRFHALTEIEITGEGAKAIVSLFRARPFAQPPSLAMMERHPFGAQAFWPLSGRPWLAAVAPDEGGRPGAPIVFAVPGDQGVCYAPNVWHHPLLVFEPADFLVVDRDRPEDNLEEARYDTPYPVLL